MDPHLNPEIQELIHQNERPHRECIPVIDPEEEREKNRTRSFWRLLFLAFFAFAVLGLLVKRAHAGNGDVAVIFVPPGGSQLLPVEVTKPARDTDQWYAHIITELKKRGYHEMARPSEMKEAWKCAVERDPLGYHVEAFFPVIQSTGLAPDASVKSPEEALRAIEEFSVLYFELRKGGKRVHLQEYRFNPVIM